MLKVNNNRFHRLLEYGLLCTRDEVLDSYRRLGKDRTLDCNRDSDMARHWRG